jgi:predicted porin
MKKASLVLAVLAASTSAAWAQSSVTLYGIVDAGVRYTTNANVGVSQKQLIPGGMSQSRLGINVTEDMGGGLKGLVNMEHRLNSDTGTVAAAEFWRQAWVGLQSSEYGQVRLGRQYNLLFDLYTSSYASFRYSPYIEAYKPEIGMSLLSRNDNMVKYIGQVGNIFFSAQVSAGEGASGAAATVPNKSMGGMVRYNDGKFAGGAAYLQVTEQTGKKVKATTFGGSYTAGPLYVHAGWAENKFENPFTLLNQSSAAAFGASAALNGLFDIAAKTRGGYTAGLLGASVFNADSADIKSRTMLSFGVTYQVTPQFNLGASAWLSTQKHYGSQNNLAAPFAAALAASGLSTNSANTSKASFFAIVADYAFSKRTDVYAEVDLTRLNSAGEVRFANGAIKRGGATLGIRHRF